MNEREIIEALREAAERAAKEEGDTAPARLFARLLVRVAADMIAREHPREIEIEIDASSQPAPSLEPAPSIDAALAAVVTP